MRARLSVILSGNTAPSVYVPRTTRGDPRNLLLFREARHCTVSLKVAVCWSPEPFAVTVRVYDVGDGVVTPRPLPLPDEFPPPPPHFWLGLFLFASVTFESKDIALSQPKVAASRD